MDFKERMANNSNEELVKIVYELRNDYTPEAVAAAEEELKKRNLDQSIIDKAKETISQQNAIEKEKSNEELSLLEILSILATFGISSFIIYLLYKSDGKTRKANQLKKLIKYIFIFYLAIIFLAILFPRLA